MALLDLALGLAHVVDDGLTADRPGIKTRLPQSGEVARHAIVN